MSDRTDTLPTGEVTLRLLGQFVLIDSAGRTIILPTQKSKALIAMTALAGPHGIDRGKAADILWSRGSSTQARANLRQTLASVRKCCPADVGLLISDTKTIRLRDAVVTDVADLNEANGQRLLENLDGLGPVLDGLDLEEPDFADWLSNQRATLQRRLAGVLAAIAEDMMQDRNWADAKRVNDKLLAMDSFDEAAHRQAIRLFSASGAEAQAVRHYDKMAALFRSELGIDPSLQTQNLMATLRAGSVQTDQADTDPSTTPPKGNRIAVTVHRFDTVHDDPAALAFSGMAEDIATELGRFRTIDVSLDKALQGGNSSGDRTETGGFALTGSIRTAGSQARVSVQLLDRRSGTILWAERFDHALADGFDAQDDITRSVAAVVPGRVQTVVADRAARRAAESSGAHELMLQGKKLRDDLNPNAMLIARPLLERAILLDPDHARAQMYLSDTYVVDIWLGLGDKDAPQLALHHARSAIAADPSDVFVQDHLGFAFLANGMWADGQTQIEKALHKIGNEVESNAWCGYALALLGQHEAALTEVLQSTARDPDPPATFGWIRAQVFSFDGQDENCIAELLGPSVLNSLGQAFLVGSYARLGRLTDAKLALEAFVEMRREELLTRGKAATDGTVLELAGGFRAMWRRQRDWDHIAHGLSLAGLPD